MNESVCQCGHAKSEHADHYEYHQCFVLGCGCVNFEAAQQSVQADECPGSSDGKHEFYQGSTWRICAHCGTRR